jgi:hypothetical protein
MPKNISHYSYKYLVVAVEETTSSEHIQKEKSIDLVNDETCSLDMTSVKDLAHLWEQMH